MADVAAARREARRRRILENAEDRLQRITNFHRGVETVGIQPAPNMKTPQIIEPTPTQRLPLLSNCTPTPKPFNEETVEEEPFIIPTTNHPTINDSLPSNFRNMVILVLGFAMRYLNLVFEKFDYLIWIDLSALHVSKIFMPLLAYEIGEFFIARPALEESGTFNLLLTLNNINPARLQVALKTLNMFVRLLRDMSLYFFAFVVLDIIFSFVVI